MNTCCEKEKRCVHLPNKFDIKIFFMTDKNRKVKLYSQCRRSQKSHNGLKEVPWLNVSGVWLEQAGFNIGLQVEIIVRDQELIIKPLD